MLALPTLAKIAKYLDILRTKYSFFPGVEETQSDYHPSKSLIRFLDFIFHIFFGK